MRKSVLRIFFGCLVVLMFCACSPDKATPSPPPVQSAENFKRDLMELSARDKDLEQAGCKFTGDISKTPQLDCAEPSKKDGEKGMALKSQLLGIDSCIKARKEFLVRYSGVGIQDGMNIRYLAPEAKKTIEKYILILETKAQEKQQALAPYEKNLKNDLTSPNDTLFER